MKTTGKARRHALRRGLAKGLLLILVPLIGGCAMRRLAAKPFDYVKNVTLGEYYLQNGRYREGLAQFRAEVAGNPRNAEANYYLGRFCLAARQPAKALIPLSRAVALDPGQADYHFWLGVAQGASGRPKHERASYEKALALDPKHIQAWTYLGHNRLEAGLLISALAAYQKAIALWPENPQALFNRAVILGRLGRTPEEKLAWQIYMAYHPAGSFALQAADRLNALEDFTYRNFRFGRRSITLEKIYFEPFSGKLDLDGLAPLNLIGTLLTNNRKLTLQVVAYQQKNLRLAHARVVSIKRYLLKAFPRIKSERIRMSWFDVPEEIKIDGRTVSNPESIVFFTQ